MIDHLIDLCLIRSNRSTLTNMLSVWMREGSCSVSVLRLVVYLLVRVAVPSCSAEMGNFEAR